MANKETRLFVKKKETKTNLFFFCYIDNDYIERLIDSFYDFEIILKLMNIWTFFQKKKLMNRKNHNQQTFLRIGFLSFFFQFFFLLE